MAKYVKKNYRFEPSPSPDVAGYNLYWGESSSELTYDSDKIDLGMPSDMGGAPARYEVELGPLVGAIEGSYNFAVAAYDEAGNEASLGGIVNSVTLDFVAPEKVGFAEVVNG